MSFQAYLDTIKAQTGLMPEDFLALAKEKGLLEPGVKPTQIVDWLKQDYGLGRGHAMALIVTFNAATQPRHTTEEGVALHFTGQKAAWRQLYDDLIAAVSRFGDDVSVNPGNSYVSLLRGGKKFAIIAVTADRIDIGIKRKGVPPTERFEPAGTWNSMVTHRVRIADAKQLDAEVLDWLDDAYRAAVSSPSSSSAIRR